MKREEDDVLLRVFLSETARLGGKPLYEAIVYRAREMGMAGATVLRGVMGFGADKRMHTSKVVDLSENLPMIVEIIDSEDAVNRFLPYLDEVVKDGFITLEKLHVIRYRK